MKIIAISFFNFSLNFYSFLGASADIKEAITKSTPETEEKAWKTIVPLVIKLKHFFEFSSKLEIIVPDIMNLLCNFPRKKSQGEERRICAGRAEENNYFRFLIFFFTSKS